MSVTYIWLLAGGALVLAETVGISGIGLLFAGLGAITVGALTNLGVISEDGTVVQFIIFFIATAGWTGMLWKPMKKFKGHKHGGYNNIVGDTAYVGSNGLDKDRGGEVTWSGTIMKAQLAKNSGVSRLDAGSQVVITEVMGATLIVKPKE